MKCRWIKGKMLLPNGTDKNMNKENIRLKAVLEWCKRKDKLRPSFIKEYSQERHAIYRRGRRREDAKFYLRDRIDCLIRRSLKRGRTGKLWEKLPFSLTQLKRHLIKTLPSGYTWQDFMEGNLDIEHITPVAVFNFTKPEDLDFQRCWALSNLRLLTPLENRRKHTKLLFPFQKAFPFEVFKRV